MTETTDTIAAAATPPGLGGIGVVRISGGDTERLARAMLGSLPEPRTASYRTFRGRGGEKLDEGLALYFPAPASVDPRFAPTGRRSSKSGSSGCSKTRRCSAGAPTV